MKRYVMTLPALNMLAQIISKLDHEVISTESKQSVHTAHTIIENTLGEDCALVYSSDESELLDPEYQLKQFQLEQTLKSKGVLFMPPILIEQRRPQGGILQRLKDSIVMLGEKWGWV